MKKKIIRISVIVFVLLVLLLGYSIGSNTPIGSIISEIISGSAVPSIQTEDAADSGTPQNTLHDSENSITEDGEYTEYADVAEYIHLYSRLPDNYITKREAMDLGWVSSEGNLWEVADQKCIGGDIFGNREGRLPDEAGRIWYECDVNYDGGFRNAERLVYSNDGLIYYTSDHYETFIKLY